MLPRAVTLVGREEHDALKRANTVVSEIESVIVRRLRVAGVNV